MSKNSNTVICGAGIAGISTAFVLAVDYGVKNILLVDERPPMTLTSVKSSECYRNWWPGPGNEMVRMMNRSIDRLQEMAIQSNNKFHMNQRGYLYVTSSDEGVKDLQAFAEEASSLGAGELRIHRKNISNYQLNQSFEDDHDFPNNGADLFLNSENIQSLFPYLSTDIKAVLHVRKAGWLSAHQLGMYMLEEAKRHGVTILQDKVDNVQIEDNQVVGVMLASGKDIECQNFINAAGPMLATVGALLGETILVENELHLKSIIEDHGKLIDRDAPLVINADQQAISWSSEEKEFLQSDDSTAWLTDKLPSGAHFRPEGGDASASLLLLWDVKNEPAKVKFPIDADPFTTEIALRGLRSIIPGFDQYIEKMSKPIVDGGYYTHTIENRPLAGPTNVDGSYLIGAMSGFGIMASLGMAELLSAYICENKLPSYASAFQLSRYQDEEYQEKLLSWGENWQL